MRAFTLIEVLVAIFILTVGIIGVLSIFPFGTRMGKLSQMRSTAIFLAQAKMEEMVSKPYDEIPVGATFEDYNSIPDFPSYKRITEIDCLDQNLISVPCDYDLAGDPNPIKRIKVSVFWRSPFGEKKFSLFNLVAKK